MSTSEKASGQERTGRGRTVALATAATAVAVVAAATGGVGAASAADGNTSSYVNTLTKGFCVGHIDAGVGHYPGQVALFVSGNL
ncbi:hypothetical protein [Gordonia jinhuaensis]|nr:hypothetical protein [Gordonia jinhuaensis]